MFKNRFKIFIFFAIVTLLFSLLWGYLENKKNRMMASIQKKDSIIGQIYKLNNESLKNDSREIFWSELKRNELIYFGDAIQTQIKSTVQIKLSNHQILVIEPETLVRFNKKDDDISLDLLQGEIKIAEALDADKQNPSETLSDKKVFIKTRNGFVDTKKENILKITNKTNLTEDKPLFINLNKKENANIQFDDNSQKTKKLIPQPVNIDRQPSALNSLPAAQPTSIQPVAEPITESSPAPLQLSVPKIKKLKLSVEE